MLSIAISRPLSGPLAVSLQVEGGATAPAGIQQDQAGDDELDQAGNPEQDQTA